MLAPRPGSIGIMGGTFDPIHLGHLAIAAHTQAALGLERILFIPAGSPPHKPLDSVSPAHDRVAMVRLAIADRPGFELSTLEVDRPGPSYTADTVAALEERERAAGRTPDLTLILSDETFRDLPGWHEPERLLATCRMAVVQRPGYPAPDRSWLAAQAPGAQGRVDFLEGPRLDISSTSIRKLVAEGRSIRGLVPPAVDRYVAEHHLYRPPNSSESQGRTSTP
ncbi:MAG TPA: nicotinate-nucleotide adenylyltransferase [Candidatus Eisenbacteria bacterium]|nr:nicotinate-nucleotide adenylyltransferase [Candidatus Eisenbacteria bacterium]